MKAPRALTGEYPILSPSLDRIIAAFPLPVIIHDDQNQILQMSEGWTHFSGYTLADIHTVDDWTRVAYGEERMSVNDYIDSLFAEDRTLIHGECSFRATDGTIR